eukprot:UC4_evm1s1267
MEGKKKKIRERLARLSGSQQSVQSLSLWIIKHPQDASIVVTCWSELIAMDTTSPKQKLFFFYLANDVIQNSLREKVAIYPSEFSKVIPKAIELIRRTGDNSCIKSLVRILTVWRDRSIYKKEFLEKLDAALKGKNYPTEPNLKKKFLKGYVSKDRFFGSINFDFRGTRRPRICRKSRNEGEKLGNNAKKASNMLAVHIGRLAAEAEDRVNLLRILNATFNTQRKALKEERSKLKDCETKRKRAVAAKESLLKRIKIVPAVPQPRRENHPIKPGNGTSGDKTVLNKETLKANRQHWPPSQRLPSPRMDAPPWWPQQNNGQMQGQSLPRAVPPYGKMN